MLCSFNAEEVNKLTAQLSRVAESAPLPPFARQPIHVLYGGAHLFKRCMVKRVGEIALAALEADHLEMPETVRARVREKLNREPVEDYRIDFEDGFGSRSDPEEDEACLNAAAETAAAPSLPPFFGIRVKALAPETRQRALRTLDLYLTALLGKAALPANFAVTLPKVTDPLEVAALSQALALLEEKLRCDKIAIEIMVETPLSLYSKGGTLALPSFVAAAQGRLRGAHFGAYDYTASLGIASSEQSLGHPACDHARQVMKLSLANAWLSDGATSVLPVGTDPVAIKAALRLAYVDVRRSLHQGFYQGWDLHPAQLPARYAAIYTFFAEGLDEATRRLRNFVEKAAQASTSGTSFDDAATGQGLLNFFLRGLSCGALTNAHVSATGLTVKELELRSFAKILEARR